MVRKNNKKRSRPNKGNRSGGGNNTNSRGLQTYNRHIVVTRLESIFGRSELDNPYSRIHKYEASVFTNSTSSNYTFTSGSDIRFIAFSTIWNALNSVGDLIGAFQYYTLTGVTLQYIPIATNVDQALTTFLSPIIANFNDDIASPGNPNNTRMASLISALIHPGTKLVQTIKQFVSPVNIMSQWDTLMNIKHNTSNSTPGQGQLELGQQLTGTFPVTPQLVGVLNVHLHVIWEGPIN
jgi:hypothetical protein